MTLIEQIAQIITNQFSGISDAQANFLAAQILALRLVQLAEDQTLPPKHDLGSATYAEGYSNCETDMWEQGWRKVILKEH